LAAIFAFAGFILLADSGSVSARDGGGGISIGVPIPIGDDDDEDDEDDDYDPELGIGVTIPIGNDRDDASNAASEMICGPNITPNVTDVMRLMVERFDGWSEEERKARCDALLSLKTAQVAWDIHQLSPGIVPRKDANGNELPRDKSPGWFEGYASQCAKPRVPCGPTVVFHSACIHAQVVNYVQWGVMGELCQQSGMFDAAHWARATMPRWMGGADNVHYDEQKIMSAVGKQFVKAERDPLGEDGGVADARFTKERQELLRRYKAIKGEMAALDRPENQCLLVCKMSEAETERLRNLKFDFRWMTGAR
jgi:hypothetical protein